MACGAARRRGVTLMHVPAHPPRGKKGDRHATAHPASKPPPLTHNQRMDAVRTLPVMLSYVG
eukprot:scaffold6417_cov95-Isochrysis_galbana.AAC.5